jgi:hypothetical protein
MGMREILMDKKNVVRRSATLTIHRRNKLNEKDKKDIALWLLRQARDILEANNEDYLGSYYSDCWYILGDK